MKAPKFLILISALGILCTTGMKCKKDKVGIDALPPATREGKNTFGCLVNGKVFVPKGSNLGGPILSSYYQYLDSPSAKGYFFNVSATMKNRNGNGTEGVNINSNNLIIKQGQSYMLKNSGQDGEIYGSYGLTIGINSNDFTTKGQFRGELYISTFDEIKQIVSGTFWFDAVNDQGEKVEVREGRFDVHFVR